MSQIVIYRRDRRRTFFYPNLQNLTITEIKGFDCERKDSQENEIWWFPEIQSLLHINQQAFETYEEAKESLCKRAKEDLTNLLDRVIKLQTFIKTQ